MGWRRSVGSSGLTRMLKRSSTRSARAADPPRVRAARAHFVGALDVPRQREFAGGWGAARAARSNRASVRASAPAWAGARRLGQRLAVQVAEQPHHARGAVGRGGLQRGASVDGGLDALHRQQRVGGGDMQQRLGLEVGHQRGLRRVRDLQYEAARARAAVAGIGLEQEVAVALAAQRAQASGQPVVPGGQRLRPFERHLAHGVAQHRGTGRRACHASRASGRAAGPAASATSARALMPPPRSRAAPEVGAEIVGQVAAFLHQHRGQAEPSDLRRDAGEARRGHRQGW